MKIAWLSPAAGNSGVVEYTRQVLPTLGRYAETELWSHGPADSPPEGVRVIDYAAEPAALNRLTSYDAVFYNLGNHLLFHRAVYDASVRCPGLAILHDRTLHHFFAGYYVSYLRAPARYVTRMSELYGERGHEVALEVIAHRGELAWRYPEEVLEHAFIEDALHNAIGAIVHSASHAQAVEASWPGPICQLSMPAYDTQLNRSATPPAKSPGNRFTLMSIGHVEPNKQILTLIQSLADSPDLADRVRYLVLGPYDPRSAYVRDVNRTIADAGLARSVTLLGYQTSAMLERYAALADAFVNLRSPNLESGSATLMEQLARGRPIIVYDSGIYSELPDDVVAKVRPHDLAQLEGCVRDLIDNPQLGGAIGHAARRYAEDHAMDDYARELIEFAKTAPDRRLRLLLADQLGAAMGGLGLEADDDAAGRMEAELNGLLG